MSDFHATSYDELPYGAHCLFYTHPDALAAAATLVGLKPGPIERCQLAELGCGEA